MAGCLSPVVCNQALPNVNPTCNTDQQASVSGVFGDHGVSAYVYVTVSVYAYVEEQPLPSVCLWRGGQLILMLCLWARGREEGKRSQKAAY